MVRFEGGAPVINFRDPRANARSAHAIYARPCAHGRCLIENQIYRWRSVVDGIGVKIPEIRIVSDWLG